MWLQFFRKASKRTKNEMSLKKELPREYLEEVEGYNEGCRFFESTLKRNKKL
jgi:hypothetical protein